MTEYAFKGDMQGFDHDYCFFYYYRLLKLLSLVGCRYGMLTTSNTIPIADYFIGDKYKICNLNEINFINM